MSFIRKADINDARQIAELNVRTWNDAYKGLIPQDLLDARRVDDKRIADWQKTIQNGNLITLVYDDGQIQGYLCAGPHRDDIGIACELYAIYVKTDNQKKGIGSLLFDEYRRLINNQPFYLYMLTGNPASSFYQKMGGKPLPKHNRILDINSHKIDEEIYVFNM